ncbi:MAG: hypothetical protein ACRDGM_00165 [bacterium]
MKAATAALIARRSLGTRPRRTLVLLIGYGVGVAVMLALLAVGDALHWQAQDKDVISGGDVVLLPEGIDPEVLKVGGVTAMFLAIPNARFLVRQVLLGPRYAGVIDGVSPEIADSLVYLRTPRGIHPAKASADLPDLARQSRSALAISASAWKESPHDRKWLKPDPLMLLTEIDRFHRPVKSTQGRSWAEWWYFNFSTPDSLYGYVSMVADRSRRVLAGVTVVLPDGRIVRWTETHAATALPFDGSVLQAGPHRVTLTRGMYRLHLVRPDFSLDLEMRPVAQLYVPPVEWTAGTFVSGYVVPILRAEVSGVLKVGRLQFLLNGTGYHDHNWGLWEAVTWEWGTVSTADYALLAGMIRHPSLGRQQMLVSLYGAHDSRPGLLGLLRASAPTLEEWRPGPLVEGVRLRVPGRLAYRAVNDAGDHLHVRIEVKDIINTPGKGHVFLQLRARYRVEGEVGGRSIDFTADGFVETFVPRPRER